MFILTLFFFRFLRGNIIVFPMPKEQKRDLMRFVFQLLTLLFSFSFLSHYIYKSPLLQRYLRRQLTFKKLKLEGNKEEEEETEKGEEAEKDKEKENLANEVAQLKSEKNQWKAEKERMEVELAELRRAKEKEVEEQKNEKEKLESELATLRLELEKEKEVC